VTAGYRSSKIGQTGRNHGAQIPRAVNSYLHRSSGGQIPISCFQVALYPPSSTSTSYLRSLDIVGNTRQGHVLPKADSASNGNSDPGEGVWQTAGSI